MSEENEGQTEQQDAPETVRLAKDMGWKDPANWQGEPPKNGFVSASEYVRRSEKILPIVNARAKKAEEEVGKLRGELEQTKQEHRDTIRRIERMSEAALKQQRSQIESDYAARKEAAVDTGDKAAYRQAVKEEKEATQALDDRLKEDEPDDKGKKGKDATPAAPPPAIQKVLDGWMDANPWFMTDEELRGIANAKYRELTRDKPGMDEESKLAAVRAHTKKRAPEKFEEAEERAEEDTEEKPRGSRVEGGSRLGGGNGGSKWSKVPADVRKMAENAGHIEYFLKSGETLEKNTAQARERWAEKYLEDAS